MKFINKYSFIIVFLIVLCIFIPTVVKSKSKISDNSDEPSSQSETSESTAVENTSQETLTSKATSTTQEKSKEVQSTASRINKETTSSKINFAPEVGNFKQGNKSYFNDALFIGDSRTVGLRDYGDLKNADYYASVGMSVYNLKKNTVEINNVKTDFEDFINKKQYKKIYISLGLNEIGYNKSTTIQQYKNLINELQNTQKDAIIFINANLLVTEHCSNTDKYSHNNEIIKLNNMLSNLADGKKTFYIDVNTVFGDGRGNMQTKYSGDGTHIYAKYYTLWSEWLEKRTV